MSRKEIGEDGIGRSLLSDTRPNGRTIVPLSKAALAHDRGPTEARGLRLVFPSRAKTPYSGFGKSKAALDRAVLAAMKNAAKNGAKVDPLPNWTLHDLRRTAKTLMVRAGVRPEFPNACSGTSSPASKALTIAIPTRTKSEMPSKNSPR